MNIQVVPPQGTIPQSILPANTTDEKVIELWLAGKSIATVDAYKRDIGQFRLFTGYKPLQLINYQDVVDYAKALEPHYSQAARNRKLAAVKSFFSFGEIMGYCQYNVASALRLKKPENRMARRILPQETIYNMVALTFHPRDKILLRLLYKTGIRANEACTLQWADCIEREYGGEKCGQITVHGKGNKSRTIPIDSPSIWQALMELPHVSPYVFTSEHANNHPSQHLSTNRVYRIVRDAAIRADTNIEWVDGKINVSPHWLRHAHISHALDNGASVHVVQATVGHASLDTTSRYAHVKPNESSSSSIKI